MFYSKKMNWRVSTSFVVIFMMAMVTTQALVNSPPLIVKQPQTDEILFKVAEKTSETDKPFTIECEAEGQPDPTYRWIKNGKKFDWQAYDERMLQHPGRGTLVISKPQDEDQGQYQCFAENEFGVATSNSVFVRKAELNSFKDEAKVTVSANEGEPFLIKCQPPDGWPKPNVEWMYQNPDGFIRNINDSRITVDPEGNLWFSNVTTADHSTDFSYACAASSVFRTEYKLGNPVLLNVQSTSISAGQNRHQPEKQYVSRKNENALRGKKVELFCIFGGTPLPQIVWTKNGKSINWSDRITQGHYGKSLLIKHASFADRGSYTCEASNGFGKAQSYSINLDVLSVPYFTTEPEIVNAAEEETAEFRCEASGVPEPTIKWIHNGKPIADAPPNDRRTVTSNSIIIRDLVKLDTGNYGCNATNSLGYVYKDVYLNVLALKPEIKEAPRNVETVDSQKVTMMCRVFGAPKPEVKWMRNGQELTGGKYKILETGDLEISNVAFSDSSNYTCFAKNKFGSEEASGSLEVREHTKIIEEPKDYEVPASTQATFRCNAVADPSLKLEIEWWKDEEPINFETDVRFVKTSDNSLIISKTVELDSGVYTCVAKTQLDEVKAQATLIVQDVPNAPKLVDLRCDVSVASITWEPMGDNRSPILYYIVQYNTSFTPDTWEQTGLDKIPSNDFTTSVQMSPWANYTFRVIAANKIGLSQASKHSQVCSTDPSVPFKNPDNVKGKGTTPNNLVISWTPMPEIEHNAPNFQYRVSYKRDIENSNWQSLDVNDWKQSEVVIPDQPTFEKYLLKVIAINKMGQANVSPDIVEGYSGEDIPLEAPTNFTLVEVVSSTTAFFTWNPVNIESVRGHFKGYKIQTWTEAEGEDSLREMHVKGDANQAMMNKFKPDSKNFARVLAYNSQYNGPSSAVIDFLTPEGVPSPVQYFAANPLGSSGFLLKWHKPLETNGKLTGYKIYYSEVIGTEVGPKREKEPHITDPNQTSAKLAGLKPNTKYRIAITATTKMGEGAEFFIERNTLPPGFFLPDTPTFTAERLDSDNGYATMKVQWHPNTEGRSGSHFFAKHRVKGYDSWKFTKPELSEDFLIIKGLDPNTVHEVSVVAVDGNYEKESLIQEIDTRGAIVNADPTGAVGPIIVRSENVATAGWFIGMMLAIAFLLLLLIIICIIKRNRGGKYDVHDREMANGRRDYPDESGFQEYSQPLDTKSTGRQSVGSTSLKPGPESDTDSMAEYGEGDTEGMNEDGSFIGQYGPKDRQPDTNSQAFATLV